MDHDPVVGRKQVPVTPNKGSRAESRSRVKNPCTICGEPGIPGIIRGAGKCQYHWNAGVWGEEYADRVRGRQ